MNFDFASVEKGRYGARGFPEDVLRVTKKGLAISANLATKLLAGKYTTENGSERTYIKLAVDVRNQAIQVQGTTDVGEGFSFAIEESGRLWGVLPKTFIRHGLPTGDYKVVEGQSGPGVIAKLVV